MEYLEKVLKKTGMSSLISSIIFAILGIILIARPEGTIKVIRSNVWANRVIQNYKLFR